ncbi:MAG: flagellar hook-basal body complex protein [Synergistaceae bacterium]|nr:flagellar hook-basal body complex protein [Synergistaceae bacterium]MBQ4401427.1 flagellar hook-basal body complex protein [Synergistaceae bacterium]MBQ6114124.1 flagellar hook-basal body complex protein [Synergistaceae bacterium]
MLRSLMTAVTGVRAHQTMLDVTGNNISNANTTGFKKDNTIFADLMYQANKYASSADGLRGGINPAQVGLGVSVAAIETIHTQGSSSYTGNSSDMMIQDRGFFVYSDGNNQMFSRSGACTLDGNADLVQSGTGYKLQGYKMEETALEGFQQAAELSTINIPIGQKMEAKATTRVDYQCNLDSRQGNFLSYGFADLPFNAVAGANGLNEGMAKVPMNGVEYDMSFSTSFAATANLAPVESTTTRGVNYLSFALANGGETTSLTFDMTNINSTTGKPMLNLPTIDVNGATYTSTAATNENPTTDDAGNLVGWLDENNNLVTMNGTALQATINKTTAATAPTADTIKSYYKPVYRFPGQTPPKYFTASYNDETGNLQIRTITLADADNNEVATSMNGLRADLEATTGEQARATHLKIDSTVFNYDVKGKMDYANFTVSGAPTISVTGGTEPTARVQQEFNFIAEFQESNMAAQSPSDLGKTVSKMVLWYYGYSNGDNPTGTEEEIRNGTVANLPKSMHKMEANVFFNADGSFDRVDWNEVNNDNAPLGFRILSGTVPGVTGNVGPNFQITAGTASNASTKSDALNFMIAQTLDSPASTDQLGSWNTVGTTAQGGYHATKATIYDDDGKEHTLEVTYKKVTENRWRWEAFIVEQDENGNDIMSSVMPEPRSGEIEFDGSGKISNAIADGSLRSTENAEVTITVPFSLNGQPNSPITLNFGGGGDALLGVTQFASETTTKPVYQDGYTMGILKNYSVAANGTITGSYSNGVSIPLYRVALATFANEQGLEKVGNTMFQASVNSGTANIDGAGSNGKGTIMGQYVEMSNVDLTEEFTHLIIAQRGFQANTRVVTVSDQILEEVVNLKR